MCCYGKRKRKNRRELVTRRSTHHDHSGVRSADWVQRSHGPHCGAPRASREDVGTSRLKKQVDNCANCRVRVCAVQQASRQAHPVSVKKQLCSRLRIGLLRAPIGLAAVTTDGRLANSAGPRVRRQEQEGSHALWQPILLGTDAARHLCRVDAWPALGQDED